MCRKRRDAQRGLTLIEVMISFSLLSLVLMTMATGSLFVQRNSQEQIHRLRQEQNIRYAVIAIEKRFQQSNQQRIRYEEAQQLFTSELFDEDKAEWYTVFFQFNGMQAARKNTWLYFHQTSGTLRVNLNGEHNVLLSGIDTIHTAVVIPDRLVRLTVICKATGYEASTDIRLHWPVEVL